MLLREPRAQATGVQVHRQETEVFKETQSDRLKDRVLWQVGGNSGEGSRQPPGAAGWVLGVQARALWVP